MQIDHDCKTELREASLRATPARVALMNLLEKSKQPLDVQTMISYLEKKSIETDPATVFRIINMFTNRGLTRQIQLNEGKSRYEISTKAEHHHLICERCEKLEDMTGCNIEKLEKEILIKKRFKVKNHSLEFFGICQNCRR